MSETPTKTTAGQKRAPAKRAAPNSPKAATKKVTAAGKAPGRTAAKPAATAATKTKPTPANHVKRAVAPASPAATVPVQPRRVRSRPVGDYTCETCGRVFQSDGAFGLHQLTAHGGASAPPPHAGQAIQTSDVAPQPAEPNPQPAPGAAPLAAYFPSTKPKQSRGLIAAVVIVVVALVGGGLGVFLATRKSGPSKMQYIAGADPICRTTNASVATVAKPTSYPELATAAATVTAATNGQVERLRALDRPGGADGVAIAAMVTSLDGAGQAAGRLRDAATSGNDGATVTATKQMGTAFNNASADASAYGFSDCASGLKPAMDAVFGGSSAVIKTAFVAKADTICRAGAREFAGIPKAANGSGPEIARAVGAVSDVAERMGAEIRALPVPPGDEAVVADMLAAQDAVNAKAREIAAAAGTEDAAAFVAAAHQIDTLSTAVDAKFDAYGLGSCGTDFGTS